MRPLNVLVACEESQAVCLAFRKRGHNAFSCDLQECSGGHPEWHIQDDCIEVFKCREWDLKIGFPECKYLCWSGERWVKEIPGRNILRHEAFDFFKTMLKHCHCVENSLSLFLERNGFPPTQKIHPFHFGDPYRKTTCLWLNGLKPLIPTNIVWNREPSAHNQWPSKERSKIRAKTYPGIARAMAEQWSPDLGNTWNL